MQLEKWAVADLLTGVGAVVGPSISPASLQSSMTLAGDGSSPVRPKKVGGVNPSRCTLRSTLQATLRPKG